MHWFFLGWHSPTVTCILALQPGLFSKNRQEYYPIPKSGTIHWIASGRGPGMWAQQEQHSPARICGTIHWITSGRGPGMWAQQEQHSPARIYSDWSRKFEEPWQSRPRDWRGVRALFSPRPHQRTCQDPLTRQGGDALNSLGPISLALDLSLKFTLQKIC